jgi:hypothetical protein
LEGVVTVAVGAERDAAVQHDVSFGVERIREHQDGRVIDSWIRGAAEGERLRVPLQWELRQKSGEDRVRRRVSPQHQVTVGNVGVADFAVGFDPNIPTKHIAP